MKNQFILAAFALLISAAVTAQNAQQTQTRNQAKEKVRTEVKNQPQGPVQVQNQEQYKNRGQAVREQRHARNAERKALKEQEKAMKKQQKEMKKMQKQQEGQMNQQRYRDQDRTSLKNKGARPAGPRQEGIRKAKGTGPRNK